MVNVIIMPDTLLKPKRQMTAKQMEALQKGREKRHQQMRTNNVEPENFNEQYVETKAPQPIEKHVSPPPVVTNNDDFESRMKRELIEKEHQFKIKELELKMQQMEAQYAKPKEEKKQDEPKVEQVQEEPKFIFRNSRIRRNII